MKVETTVGALIATVAVAYIVGQGVGAIKVALLNIAYDDLHDSKNK